MKHLVKLMGSVPSEAQSNTRCLPECKKVDTWQKKT